MAQFILYRMWGSTERMDWENLGSWRRKKGGFLIYFLLFHDYSPFSLFLLPSENPSFILHLFSQFFSQRSHLTFPFLFSSNSLNIFGTVETYFSITVPLITSVVLSPHRHVDTPAPSPPNIISLVWQLLSWKTAVTASATQKSTWKGEENWTTTIWTHTLNYADPWPITGWVQSQWKFQALVKTGQSGWGSSSAVGQILQDFGSAAVVDT